jgi:hypothetical protein
VLSLVACAAAASLLNPLLILSGAAFESMGAVGPSDPPSPPDSLYLVAVIDGEFAKLTVLGDAVLLRHETDGLGLGRLSPNGFVRDESLASGIASCGFGERAWLSGRFPEGAWLVRNLQPYSACPAGPASIFRWKGERWKIQEVIGAHQLLVAPWKRGSALMVEAPYRDGPPWGYELRVLAGPAGLRPPAPTRVARKRGGCYTVLDWPVALLTSGNGAAVVVGSSRCTGASEDDEGSRNSGPVIEYFAPGASRGRVLPVPLGGVEPSDLQVRGRDAGDVWIVASVSDAPSSLAHWNGQGWTRTKGPPGSLVGLGADAAGALWVLSRIAHHENPERVPKPSRDATQPAEPAGAARDETAVVWRKPRGKAFARVALPNEAGSPLDLTVDQKGRVWVTAQNGIYGTMRPASVLRWPGRECSDADIARVQRDDQAVTEFEEWTGRKTEGSSCCDQQSGPGFPEGF